MKPKLAICIPTHSLHPMKFTLAFGAQMLTLGLDRFEHVMLVPATSSVGAFRARNHILRILAVLEKEYGWEADYTMWFDSDVLAPSKTIQALLAHKKDIVGATYRRRSPPYELLGKPAGGSTANLSLGQLAPADRLPSGCILIKRSIFKKLEEPVFDIDVGDGVNVTGEDSKFCDKVRALGHEIWLDTMLTSMCKHIDTDHELSPEVEQLPSQLIIPDNKLILQ